MQVSNTCMGIFQFDIKNKELFKRIVKPLVESHTGLKYVDAQTYYEPASIKMRLIQEMIEDAQLLIINLSDKNPNVFIELGIAYVLKSLWYSSVRMKVGKEGKETNGTRKYHLILKVENFLYLRRKMI